MKNLAKKSSPYNPSEFQNCNEDAYLEIQIKFQHVKIKLKKKKNRMLPELKETTT
jgi:hypothetical protein